MTKINGKAITIPGFTVGLQQDTAIAPLGSFVSASNLVPLMGSRMGIRGGSRVVNTLHDDSTPTAASYTDTFVAEADGTDLPDHTPTGGGDTFTWVTGTFSACLDFFLNDTTPPVDHAILPTSGWPSQSLTANIMTNILPATKFAVDVTNVPASNVEQTVSVTATIPSGMTLDAFIGVLLGASADGSGGYALTAGYFPSAGKQRVTLWSRDAAGVCTLVSQSQAASGLFTFDVPFTLSLQYDGTDLIDMYGNHTAATISTPGYPGLIGAMADSGGTDLLRLV